MSSIYNREMLQELYEKFVSESDIAAYLGISKQAMFELRNRFGIEYNRSIYLKRITKIRHDEILELYNKINNIGGVAKKLGYSKTHIKDVLKLNKIKFVSDHRAKINIIIKMYKNGVNRSELVKYSGMTRQSLNNLIYREKKRCSSM